MWAKKQLNLQGHTVSHPHVRELPQASTAVASHAHEGGKALMTPGE